MKNRYSVIKRAIKEAQQMKGFLTEAEKDNLIEMIENDTEVRGYNDHYIGTNIREVRGE